MNTLDCALMLLDEGIETIPLDKYKNPLMKFKNLPMTKELITDNNWRYHKAPMLAVLCRGVWCIDIDINHGDGKDGFESIKSIEEYAEIVANANKTWVQRTPSGGMHLVFKKRDGIPYGQKIDYLKGVDIKAHQNNYFVLGGSVGAKGKYTLNGKEPILYQGKFEQMIFDKQGNYEEQKLSKYSTRNVLKNYDFSYLDSHQTGQGKGKEAYERIVNGQSVSRNDDLFKACSYARACGVSIEPLRVLIGDIKNGDIFTESEFTATLNSAFR